MVLKNGKVLTLISIMALLLAVTGCIDGILGDHSDHVPGVVDEAWGIILNQHIDKDQLDQQKLADGAIKGMIEALDDPYTSYLSPEENRVAKASLEGNFGGIGAAITMRDGALTVVSPLPNSPAELAGILPGDQIIEVDGLPTKDMTLTEATLHIRGKKGTKVRLRILHKGDEESVEIEVTRAKIEVPSVTWEMANRNLAHITINSFSERTGTELESALREILPENPAGIILDLRDNLGGVVTGAVSVASQFVSGGIIVYAIDSAGSREDWDAKPGGLALDVPLAVLVNEFTASASEVVAGALQDNRRGPIIGTTTYGKGVMQQVDALSNGGSLHVTFARWYTPDGHQIQGIGIIPDIAVEPAPEDTGNDRDPQLDRAIDYLTNGS